jgi:predicted protein tyrosine phosphatase
MSALFGAAMNSTILPIYVYSRNAIEAVAPHEVPHVIISITSSPGDRARLRTNELCLGILRLAFADAEAPGPAIGEGALFSAHDAARVWDFLTRHVDRLERVVVHCDAGVSRSAAVAAAIALVQNGDDREFFCGRYRPNLRVYRTLLDVHAARVA